MKEKLLPQIWFPFFKIRLLTIMDYKQIHDAIIDRAKTRNLEGYKERHHIVPKCMGGSNDKSNIAELTAREHFIVHKLLCEIYPTHQGILKAYFAMAMLQKNQRKFSLTSREYEYLRSEFSKRNSGVLNHYYGKKHSDEIREKMRRNSKRRGNSSWIAGLTKDDPRVAKIANSTRWNTGLTKEDPRIQKQIQKDNSGNWLTTYYCYDGLGRPRAIIQPIAYNLNQTINATDQAHRDFVFAFEYDSRGRLIREDIPGAGERYSVYDKADRLVMQNNALQSETGKWNFWRYDAFDREVMRGETGSIGYTQSYWQYYFDQQTIINEAWDYNTHYFTNTSFPSNTAIDYSHVKQYQIYDDYDFAASEHAFKADSAYHPRYTNAKGLLTLTVKRDLNLMDQGQYRYYTDTYYYDSKNRPIQIFSTHDMGGANNNSKYNLKNIHYNFAGEIINSRYSQMHYLIYPSATKAPTIT
jgi:YD repeat-containing protein